ALGFAFRQRGYHVMTALDGQRAAELIDRHLPDAVVLDMFLPRQSGFQIARLLEERSDGRVPVVMVSPAAGCAHHDYALALGVDCFLVQPQPSHVLAAVEKLCPLPEGSRLDGSGTLSWPAATPT
ncbi:MAG TPA: response regulator, partial [Gemmata sp.]|nr:response regulator [Gemmata sp.]